MKDSMPAQSSAHGPVAASESLPFGEDYTGPSALVRTAVALAEPQRQLILQRLRKRFGPQVRARFEVDQTLIGGVQARVGDDWIDDTIATKLAALRDALVKGGR